jgi:hypothetical protein
MGQRKEPCTGLTRPNTAGNVRSLSIANLIGAMFSRVDQLRSEAEEFLHEQHLMQWENWVLGRPLDLVRTYESHPDLFSQESFEAVAEAEKAAEGLERIALGYFHDFLLVELIGAETAHLEDRIANLQASASISVNGTTVPYRQLSVLLASEADYDLRRKISDAALPVLKELNPLLEEKELTSQRRVEELGFGGYAELSERLRRVDLTELASRARALLDSTETLYESAASGIEEALELEPERLRWCDVGWLFRSDRFRPWFPAERMLEILQEFLDGIGIHLEGQTNIRIEAESQEGKNPRAVCFPMKVPGDIRLSVKPVGGVTDYRALFHEMGHAQHFAHTTTPYFEFQQLGSYTTTEAYAFLFEGMLENPVFLREVVGLAGSDLAGYIGLTVYQKLFLIRRYAAKLLYELELHDGLVGAKESYRRRQSEATRMELNDIDAERYLVDVDSFFYSADYYRAWHLEAMLDRFLEARLGGPWFRGHDVLTDLQPLWSVGSAHTGKELAEHVGYDDFSEEPLLQRLASRTAAADTGRND